jgi:hypothetical protein
MPGSLPFDTNGSTAENGSNQANDISKDDWHDDDLSDKERRRQS